MIQAWSTSPVCVHTAIAAKQNLLGHEVQNFHLPGDCQMPQGTEFLALAAFVPVLGFPDVCHGNGKHYTVLYTYYSRIVSMVCMHASAR